MRIREFIRGFEEIIPLGAVGYERDAVGLQVVGDEESLLTHVLFSYEVTHEVVEEAQALGANLIVAFHPLIFPNLPTVTEGTRTGSLVRELVRADIALYVVHTAFDSQPRLGTSRLMAEALGLEHIEPLQPLQNTLNKLVVFVPQDAVHAVHDALTGAGAGRVREYESCSFQVEGQGTFRGSRSSNPTVGRSTVLERVDEVRIEMVCERWNTARAVRAMIAAHPYEEVAYDIIPLANPSANFGMGAVGDWQTAKPIEELLSVIKHAFGSAFLRYNAMQYMAVSRVALLGGSGMDYYSAALRSGAGAFITADVRYHDFHRARHDNIMLIDAGHAETERFVVEGMLQVARQSLEKSSIGATESDRLLSASQAKTSAVCYF